MFQTKVTMDTDNDLFVCTGEFTLFIGNVKRPNK